MVNEWIKESKRESQMFCDLVVTEESAVIMSFATIVTRRY